MTRLTPASVALIAWLYLASLAHGQATTDVLRQIPQDARGYVVTAPYSKTLDKVDALLARVQAPVPSLNDMTSAFADVLDQDRGFGIAWLPARDGDDAQSGLTHFVLFAPAKDYASLVQMLSAEDTSGSIASATLAGEAVVVAKKGDFAIVAQQDDEASLEHVLNADGNMLTKAPGLTPWIRENDVTIALSTSGTELLFDRLMDGLELVKQGALAVSTDGADVVEASLEIYRGMFESGRKTIQQAALGVRLDPEKSVELHYRMVLKPDSEATAPPPKPKNPSLGLPSGPYLFAFEGPMPQFWSENLMMQGFNVLSSMQGPDAKKPTKQQLAEFNEAAKQTMAGVHSLGFVMGVGEPNQDMYSRTVITFQVDDAPAYVDRYQGTIDTMSNMMKNLGLSGYEVEAQEVDNTKVLNLTMDMSKFVPPAAQGAGAQQEIFAKLFGPDGKLAIYVAAPTKNTVVMAYSSKENLKRAMAAARAGTSLLRDDEPAKQTEAMLLPKAQWAMYLSPAGVVQFAGSMAATFAPPAADVAIPEFPPSPPIGIAAESTPTHFDAQIVIPMETIDATMKFIGSFQ